MYDYGEINLFKGKKVYTAPLLQNKQVHIIDAAGKGFTFDLEYTTWSECKKIT